MTDIPEAIKRNHDLFSKAVSESIAENIENLSKNEKSIESYARIAAVNSVKIDLVDPCLTANSAHFFFEAHNDLILSHVNANIGSWRPALQSLRSFMENTLSAIYYADHPIELQKWAEGKFFIQPKDLREYVCDHPKVFKLASAIGLKSQIDAEYATLSKAVHGSSILFRMTSADGKTNIAKPNAADLGKWATRERVTVSLCMTIVAAVMQDHLAGARLPNLRESLKFAVLDTGRNALKTHCGIKIPAP